MDQSLHLPPIGGPHHMLDHTLGTAETTGYLVPNKARRIQVTKNGDLFFRARTMVVPERTKDAFNFPQFLDRISENVNSNFAIQRLYTPMTGTLVQSIDDLREDVVYVAAGKERFKQLSYTKPGPNLKPKKTGGAISSYIKIYATDCKVWPLSKAGCHSPENYYYFSQWRPVQFLHKNCLG